MIALRVELITQLERLQELQAPLQRLFAQSSRATPFQCPDWWLSWAECFAAPGSLRVLLVWGEASRVLVCLPLHSCERNGEGVLGWLGEGPSDYLDVLVAEDAPDAALPLAIAALRELSGDARRVELSDVPAGSPLLSMEPLHGSPCASCPTLAPGRDAAAYRQALPHGLLRTLQRSERTLRQHAPLRWQQATRDDVQELLSIWFELHEQRWRARAQPGVLAEPSVQLFHRAAAERLLARGLLCLEVAWWGERPVAACYSLHRACSYLYLSGYVPDLRGVSLGSVILWHTIRQALARGEAVDFLRGREPYKYLWGARDTSTFHVQLATTALYD